MFWIWSEQILSEISVSVICHISPDNSRTFWLHVLLVVTNVYIKNHVQKLQYDE